MFRQYRKIDPGEFFVCFADTSAGMNDYCACQFLSKTRIDVPLIYHEKITATEMTAKLLPVLERIYDTTQVRPIIAYERNNGGMFEMERLAQLNKLGKFDVFRMPNSGTIDNAPAVKLGWDTNTATRPKMLQDLKDCIDHRLLHLYDKPTIDELYSFVLVQSSSTWKAQAEVNAHDDLVMSLAGAWQLYQQCNPAQSSYHREIPFDADHRTWGVPDFKAYS